MRHLVAVLALLFLGCWVLTDAVGGDESAMPFTPSALPAGWAIVDGVEVEKSQLQGFSSRLGGTLVSLTNQVVSVGGFHVRVNALVGATDGDADRIERAMIGLRGKDFTGRAGTRIYEVAGNNVLVARRVFAALGLRTDAEAVWNVSFEIALVDALDYTAGNRVFNHFLALEKNADDVAATQAIQNETRAWTFGNTLRLLNQTPTVTWTLDPKPVEAKRGALVTTYRFEDPPKKAGVPYVRVKGRVTTTARFAPAAAEASKETLGPTRFWPAEAEVIGKAVSAARDASGAPARVQALLAATHEAVRYGGPMGSRDGVLPVWARGYGRCWDKSDVLITLCRAAGIPARQVGGWVPAIRAGHIWTEVHVDGGWLPVDATTTWLGTGVDYIPFFATEQGPMPIVYLGMPKIERAR